MAIEIVVRRLEAVQDLRWASEILDGALAGRRQARRGELVDVLDGDALVAEVADERVGLLCYRVDPTSCDLEALVTMKPGAGIGTALLDELRRRVRGVPIRVVTTNDNLRALRFYQRRGFRLVELRAGAVDEARRNLKPTIGLLGEDDIPIRDELELVSDDA